MTTDANPDLARQILLDAGADPEHVRVEEKPFGWLVAAKEFGAGCSSGKDEAFDTPQEVAAHLVSAHAAPAAQEPPQDVPPAPDAAPAPEAPVGQGAPAPDADPVSDSGGDAVPAVGVAGGGILVLPDELGARRNAVLAAITARKLILLEGAADDSRRDFLDQAFTDYMNASASHAPISEQMEANYQEYIALRNRTNAINATAMQLERAALDAGADLLQAMYDDLPDWSA